MDSVLSKTTIEELKALHSAGASVEAIQSEIARVLGEPARSPEKDLTTSPAVKSGPLSEREAAEMKSLTEKALAGNLDPRGQAHLSVLMDRALAGRGGAQ